MAIPKEQIGRRQSGPISLLNLAPNSVSVSTGHGTFYQRPWERGEKQEYIDRVLRPNYDSQGRLRSALDKRRG